MELFVLHTLQRNACFGKARENVGEELTVGVRRMEHHAFLRGLGKLHNSTGHLVNGRELKAAVKRIVRHHADDNIRTQQGEEVICVEVDLELTVLLTGRQITYTHDLGVQSVMGYGIEHQFLGLEFRIDVFIVVDVLSEPEKLLRQFRLRTGLAVDAETSNAVRRDMDEARTGAQTEGHEVTH